MENNAHPVCIVDDKIPLGCGGRQMRVARMMWWTMIWDVGHLSVNVFYPIKHVLTCGR